MVIVEPDEIGVPIPRGDRRTVHVARVLGKGTGDELSAGIADGMAGTARVESLGDQGMVLSFKPVAEPAPLRPVTLLLGFPRPIQARRILKDITSIGVARVILSGTELGEKSYFKSDFFRGGDCRSALIEGAEQAGNPRLPRVETAWTLARALDLLDAGGMPPGARWALDPYRATIGLGQAPLSPADAGHGVVLAVGSERGWTDAELDLLAGRGFSMASLGDRILKSETACIAAVSIVLAKLGWL